MSDESEAPPPHHPGEGLSPEQAQAEAEARMIGWVMHMAGVDQDRAVKALEVSMHQEARLGPYFNALVDTKRRATHPAMGLKIHWPDKKTVTALPAAKVLDPDNFLLQRFGSNDFGAELSNYTVTVCALTSVLGRAVLAAQGYRIEFIESPWPEDKPRIIV